MLRWFVRALAILVLAVATLVVLDFAELLVPVGPDDAASMASTIPACDGRVIAEDFVYQLRDPRRGDVVAVHAAKTDTGEIAPDEDSTDRVLVLRIAAGPGDVVEVRKGNVYVDEIRIDEIPTEPFPKLTVPNEQYFLLGDNRAGALDSRTFGPVLRNAIFGRVLATFWPLRHVSFRFGRHAGASPGKIACS